MAIMYNNKKRKPTKGVKRAVKGRAWKRTKRQPGIRPKRYGVLFSTTK